MKPQDVILHMSDTLPMRPKGYVSVRRTLEYVPYSHLPHEVIGEASNAAVVFAADLGCEEVWLWVGPMKPGDDLVVNDGGHEVLSLEAEAVATCFQPVAV